MPKQTTKPAWNRQTRRPQRRRRRLETHSTERHLDPQNRRPQHRHTDIDNATTNTQKRRSQLEKSQNRRSEGRNFDPWGVTPRPAKQGDAHANYRFSPRQLSALGSLASLGRGGSANVHGDTGSGPSRAPGASLLP
nr:MAG TPA: hypothetical protein [Caudoviricetes sp.]